MRKPIAGLALVSWVIFCAILFASFSTMLADSPRLIQLLFYAIAGIIWILPMKFLFAWMNSKAKESPE